MNANRSQLSCFAWILAVVTFAQATAAAQHEDPLPSWNDGPAKAAIMRFVKTTTEAGSPDFVPESERVATFDQDGTLWVEQPVYTQVAYMMERVPEVVRTRPELAKEEPFKTILRDEKRALTKLSQRDLTRLAEVTLSGMSVEEFQEQVRKWLATSKDPRWQRSALDLTYLPMREVLAYLRAHGYKTYIVTGGGQDFVRVFAKKTYGIPPEQVIGSAGETQFGYGKNEKPVLTKESKPLLIDDGPGKPEGIHLMIGQRPRAAFGNSSGDQQMLEYTKAGEGARLSMLVLHDDAQREYAYGPALGLPSSKIGSFPQSLYDAAKRRGWIVISMKNDWRRVFEFAPQGEPKR